MELELSGDQRSFQQTVRKFLEAEAPLSLVRDLADDHGRLPDNYWSQGAELGWTSMLVSEEDGGGSLAGRPLLDLVIVAEEMGRLLSPGPLIPCNVVAAALARSGSAEQRGTVLQEIVSGQAIAAWAFAGPLGGWDADSVSMRAETDGDDFLLSGTKCYVEAGDLADHVLVTVWSDAGLTQLILRSDTPGLTVEPVGSLDFSRRFATLHFDGVRVPSSALVGTAGGAADDVEHQLRIAIALQCAETMGMLDQVFEKTLEYAQDRVAFGRQIGSYQAIKHRLADHKLWLEAGHGLATALARAIQDGDAGAAELASAAKAHIGDQAVSILQDCVHIHGGIGVTWEHDLHLYLRRATVNRVLFGDPAAHRERLCVLAGI
ncbi:acyl-CoA dehydrogenase family protein [Streptosporangium sp. NPDC002544]|uniref:acyl-CoA dehydrogenase family protein n=1 Tax=Streptosporangium sp. NPDC002544 TaxID=3154538 RepID=UPI003331C685